MEIEIAGGIPGGAYSSIARCGWSGVAIRMVSGYSRLGALTVTSVMVIITAKRVPSGEGGGRLRQLPGVVVRHVSIEIRRSPLCLRRISAGGRVFEPGPSTALVLNIDARVLFVQGHTATAWAISYTRSAHRPTENNNAANEFCAGGSDWLGISDNLQIKQDRRLNWRIGADRGHFSEA